MIKIKSEINKSATMRDLHKQAEKIYKDNWQPELQVEAHMRGVKTLLDSLTIKSIYANKRAGICKKQGFWITCNLWSRKQRCAKKCFAHRY